MRKLLLPELDAVQMTEIAIRPVDEFEPFYGYDPEPGAVLLASHGKLKPLVRIRVDKDGNEHVFDGRRSLQALREGRRIAEENGRNAAADACSSVTVMLYYGMSEADMRMADISTDVVRAQNPLTQLQNIRQLVAMGYSHDAIKETLGLRQNEYDKMVSPLFMIEELVEVFFEGGISYGVAQKISKLNHRYQKQLLDVYKARKVEYESTRRKPKIMAKDIKAVKSVGDAPIQQSFLGEVNQRSSDSHLTVNDHGQKVESQSSDSQMTAQVTNALDLLYQVTQIGVADPLCQHLLLQAIDALESK